MVALNAGVNNGYGHIRHTGGNAPCGVGVNDIVPVLVLVVVGQGQEGVGVGHDILNPVAPGHLIGNIRCGGSGSVHDGVYVHSIVGASHRQVVLAGQGGGNSLRNSGIAQQDGSQTVMPEFQSTAEGLSHQQSLFFGCSFNQDLAVGVILAGNQIVQKLQGAVVDHILTVGFVLLAENIALGHAQRNELGQGFLSGNGFFGRNGFFNRNCFFGGDSFLFGDGFFCGDSLLRCFGCLCRCGNFRPGELCNLSSARYREAGNQKCKCQEQRHQLGEQGMFHVFLLSVPAGQKSVCRGVRNY